MPPSLTRDCDLCWPFWGAIKHALLHCLHLLSMCQFALTEHISDQVKDLWLVPLPDFHAILHCHDEILGAVFSSMLRALLCCSCAPESTQCSSETDKHKIMFHWIWTAGSKPWVTLHMMAVAIDFYSRKPPISTYTEENLDHSELGGDNGRGVPGFLYNQGPGLPPDNRPEYNIPAAEEDPETMFFL